MKDKHHAKWYIEKAKGMKSKKPERPADSELERYPLAIESSWIAGKVRVWGF